MVGILSNILNTTSMRCQTATQNQTRGNEKLRCLMTTGFYVYCLSLDVDTMFWPVLFVFDGKVFAKNRK